MANISLTLYTNVFFGSALKLPIQIGTLSTDNSVRNISRLGTFKDTKNHHRLLAFHCQHVDWSSSGLDNCQVRNYKK